MEAGGPPKSSLSDLAGKKWTGDAAPSDERLLLPPGQSPEPISGPDLQEVSTYWGFKPTYGYMWSDNGAMFGRMNETQVRELINHVASTGEQITIAGGWAETLQGVKNRLEAIKITNNYNKYQTGQILHPMGHLHSA